MKERPLDGRGSGERHGYMNLLSVGACSYKATFDILGMQGMKKDTELIS